MNNYLVLYQVQQVINELSLNSWKKYCDKFNLDINHDAWGFLA